MGDVYVKGEGGRVWRLSEPLHTTIVERLESGTVTRVNKDGSTYVEQAEPDKLTPKQQLQADARALGLDDKGTVDDLTERISARTALVEQARELELDDTGTDEELRAWIDAKLAE